MKTFFYDSDKKSQVTCPNCKSQKTISISNLLQSKKEPVVKINCNCGHSFKAFFERRESQRESCEVTGKFLKRQTKQTGKIKLLNLSSNGILFLVESSGQFEISEKILVEYTHPKSEKLIKEEVNIIGIDNKTIRAEFDRSNPQQIKKTSLKTGETESLMTCPKCYMDQPKAPECKYCGVVLFKVLREKNEKESALMENQNFRKPEGSNNQVKLAGIALFLILLTFGLSYFFFSTFGKMSTEDLVENTSDSVALISHDQGNGTGFVVSNNILATNFHVIDKVFPDDLKIIFPENSNDTVTVEKIIYFDEDRDLAFIEIESTNDSLPFELKSSLKHGEDIVIIGNPGVGHLTLKNSVTKGTLNSTNEIEGQEYYQISASINPGNSGGPAFNSKGKVVAMITLKASRQEGITFGIPIDEIITALNKVKQRSNEDKKNTHVTFIMNSLFKRLHNYAVVNLYSIDLYIDGMNIALERGFSAQEGYDIVSQKIENDRNQINTSISPKKINDYLKTIYQVHTINQDLKDHLLKLWQCAQDIRSLVESPNGNLSSLIKDRNRLNKRLSKLLDVLEIKMNIKTN